MSFSTAYNIISVKSLWPVHLSMLSHTGVLSTNTDLRMMTFKPLAAFQYNFCKTMVTYERDIHPVAINIINYWKELAKPGIKQATCHSQVQCNLSTEPPGNQHFLFFQ